MDAVGVTRFVHGTTSSPHLNVSFCAPLVTVNGCASADCMPTSGTFWT